MTSVLKILDQWPVNSLNLNPIAIDAELNKSDVFANKPLKLFSQHVHVGHMWTGET